MSPEEARHLVQFGRFVVEWFIFSLIISGIAKALDRNGLFWWLMGIIGGPIALLVLVLLGPNR